jgi:hypothetical protein
MLKLLRLFGCHPRRIAAQASQVNACPRCSQHSSKSSMRPLDTHNQDNAHFPCPRPRHARQRNHTTCGVEHDTIVATASWQGYIVTCHLDTFECVAPATVVHDTHQYSSNTYDPRKVSFLPLLDASTAARLVDNSPATVISAMATSFARIIATLLLIPLLFLQHDAQVHGELVARMTDWTSQANSMDC